MPTLRSVEIDGDFVGVLTKDCAGRSFHFHSGVAPYDLLDGSRFLCVSEAEAAIARMSRAARPARRAAETIEGEVR